VVGDARGRGDVFCHIALALPDLAGDNGRGTHWFQARRVANSEWRMDLANMNALLAIRRSPRHSPKMLTFGRFSAVSP
jgi:hypothetical protein